MGQAIEAGFDLLADRLVGSIDPIVDAYIERMLVEDPEFGAGRPEMLDTYRAVTRASILVELETFRAGDGPPSDAPAIDLEFARAAARLGAPPNVLGDAYRRGHASQWEAWFGIVEDGEPDPEERRALLRRGSDFFFAYATALSRLTLDEYTRERDLMLRDREHRRVALVRELLDGGTVTADDLDYDPAATHLAFVAWGEAAGEAARLVAGALDRRLLVVAILDDTLWGWLGGGPAGAQAVSEIERVALPAGAALAFGDEAAGPEGFRSSHRQALRAERAGRRGGAAITHYAEVALAALAAADEDEARSFLKRELRGIDGDDVRATRLRDTLTAWFGAGQNAAAAAAALGVHEQTVAQRLRAVEERTGVAPAARRAELETALRLREYLG